MSFRETELEEDLDWRVDELASLKHQIVHQVKGSLAERSLLRAIWAMLYAHYEGFCLFALTVFLEEVKRSGQARHGYQEDLVIFSLRKAFRKFRGNNSDEQFYQFFKNEMATLLGEVIDFDCDSRVQGFALEGKSNLSPLLLIKNCKRLCLSVPAADNQRTKLWQLVNRRNEIAHGKSVFVRDLNEYEGYENAAYEVMLELIESVCKSLNGKEYLVNSGSNNASPQP